MSDEPDPLAPGDKAPDPEADSAGGLTDLGAKGARLTRRVSLGLLGGLAVAPSQSSIGQDRTAQPSVPAAPLLARVDARQFGVLGDGKADDTAKLNSAIAYAIRNGLILTARGTLRTTGPITIRTNSGRNRSDESELPETAQIEWARGTLIKVATDNEIGLIVQGRGIRMSDIRVDYERFQPVTHTGSVGIQFRDLSFSQLGYLEVRNANTAIAQRYASLERDFFFDNEIDSLRVGRFSRMGVVIHPRWEGNTPNVIHSISALGPWMQGPSDLEIPSTGSKLQQGIEKAVWLHGCRGLVIGKINIETCAADKALLSIDQCRGVDIGAIHFEKVALTANGASLINAYLSYARIGSMTVYNFDTGKLRGVPGATSLFNVIEDGYLDVDILETGGNHYPGQRTFMFAGHRGGHRIGRFVDNVEGTTGGAYVERNGRPKSLYMGEAPGLPMATHFDGLPIVPAFVARGSGGAVATAPGVLQLSGVQDTCRCYVKGRFTAPADGFYEIFASGRATARSPAEFNIRRNDSETVMAWSEPAEAGTPGDRRGPQKTARVYLEAGDVLTLVLAGGSSTLDGSTVFGAAFSSR